MPYKITITRTEQVPQKEEQGPWVVVETRPYTAKEINDAISGGAYGWSSEEDQKKRAEELSKQVKEIKGYAPARTVLKDTETKVFEQVVHDISLPDVICAVNGMKAK